MANGHPGWDGVGIDDDIGSDAFTGKRHVFLPIKINFSTAKIPKIATRCRLSVAQIKIGIWNFL